MKRGRTNSVSYQGTGKSKYARGTKGNPIVLEQRVSRAVNRAVNRVVEKKGVDGDMGQTVGAIVASTNTNDDAIVLNLIAPGNGSYNRVGRQVTLKSVRLWGEFIHENSTSAAVAYEGNSVRMVVVWDKIPGGTIPTYNTIFGITSQDGTETSQLWDPIRYDNMDRFRVICDRRMNFQTNAGGYDGTSKTGFVGFYKFDEYIKLPNLRTNFAGQSSPCTIADIGQGALYVYFRALAGGADNFVSLDENARYRLRYTD